MKAQNLKKIIGAGITVIRKNPHSLDIDRLDKDLCWQALGFFSTPCTRDETFELMLENGSIIEYE